MSERQVEVVCEMCDGSGMLLGYACRCDDGVWKATLAPGSRDALLLAWADARQEMNRVISAGEHWSFIEDATKAYEAAGAAIVAFDLAAHDTKEERDG